MIKRTRVGEDGVRLRNKLVTAKSTVALFTSTRNEKEREVKGKKQIREKEKAVNFSDLKKKKSHLPFFFNR